ncbi:MAG: 2-oxo-4-hydroxy-4-carboxy-5-ureidoimidazoline decarboxylase [Proteobacteria bacterium]|nr:2-oxo-4-hydroxy-4-carboxy-5-ureidoimidazoline decarboxylase [Pseudomonadota bacterium]
MRLAELNHADRRTFVHTLGRVFEHAPWVAEAAFDARPFASRDALHATMLDVVTRAPATQQVEFLNGHPELGSRATVVAALTSESRSEQLSAGLTQLSPDEFAWFQVRNRAYREKFGFPFIVAVRRQSKQGIMVEFERRLAATPDAERAQALREIGWITRLRLDDLIRDGD